MDADGPMPTADGRVCDVRLPPTRLQPLEAGGARFDEQPGPAEAALEHQRVAALYAVERAQLDEHALARRDLLQERKELHVLLEL
eukprot:CAMPEP_0113275706 /NCGR_PEP_ID=MMETSP0008_2-20120614/25095_1 /TAXON_ID=97485 /ORGANISM="Prymnesium parvum" /LENGTH=84 /DNA_ID=CAMNT_0000125443 /DNA_START=390 /DNA_END=640 /DNA_ORIENTATION=- /assembly_acc=CAM_ASM_000153